jgi:uncharacterized protein (TIGR03083 family)
MIGANVDTWRMIEAERTALVPALEKLAAEAWDKPSLCAGWTVRDVVAHMVATAQMTPPRFFAKFSGSGFRFPEMSRREIDRLTAANSDAELIDLLRARTGTRNAPPGPAVSWLGEAIVHGEDVFRALGGYREHPVEHVVAVADFYRGSNLLIGAQRRVEGLALRATDTDWRHGDGPEVSGPIIALVMAMTGRKAALDDLDGDGVAVLRGRP